MIREGDKSMEKLKKLMNSYVPEFAYEPGASDPGSVLTDLCAEMIGTCEERYSRVLSKHRIQYLNLFDPLIQEPVSASRGYVQFQPVKGYEGMVPIPAGTSVIASHPDAGELLFETEHGITAVDTVPELMVVTDRSQDRIVRKQYEPGEPLSFTAFGVEGENLTEHKLYLCFDNLLEELTGLDLYVYPQASAEQQQEELLHSLAGSDMCWSILEADGKETVVPSVAEEQGAIHLSLPDYVPQKAVVGQKEGYYLILTSLGELPDWYVKEVSVSMKRTHLIPSELYLNGTSESAGMVYPFGKPMGLYNEMSLDDREVLSRRSAKISLSFHLGYQIREERAEVPEMDLEYKAIMKKPRKPLSIRAVEVCADDVCWEYLSRTGWKRLFQEEHLRSMFNGSTEGDVTLQFICPQDMADYEENAGGRIRVRLLQAENIYQMPAIYRCPVLTGINFSYSYEEQKQMPSFIMAKNNFDEKEMTGIWKPFYQTENSRRTMYLGFAGSMAGMPLSLYFDIENYSDRPVDYQVEYLSPRGFQPVRITDQTGGFCGSGTILFMVPQDAVQKNLYGYEGYFLRFVNYNRENPEYVLPQVKGIYPNMARVVNVNTVTEEFYLDDMDNALQIQLSQQNLLKVRVEVQEETHQGLQWIEWKQGRHSYEGGRTYQIDMEAGLLSFRKHAFAEYHLPEDGPQIRVSHSNYNGSAANVPADSITTPGTAIRYLSAVTNPFPTYGGYDGYTEQTTGQLVAGLLRTRGRAVTESDLMDLISQESYGIRKVRYCNHTDAYGNTDVDQVTIAVLVEEYEKGAHVFSQVKKKIKDRLLSDGIFQPAGRTLNLIQPHFVRLNVRVWLEKDSMEQAYDMQQQALELIRRFIDPMEGGMSGQGWQIGELPSPLQLTAFLRTGMDGVSISRMLVTAWENGQERPVDSEFYEKHKNPFRMAVNGEHMVYIEVREC